MKTNHDFSFQRLLLLGKQSLLINKKMIWISLAGFSGLIFGQLSLFQHINNYSSWHSRDNLVSFLILFFFAGVYYTGLSFPAFRTREKTMAYLMLPTSNAEKFLFELLCRIFMFLILMPTIFWLVANLEGMIMHSLVPRLTTYQFSFGEAYSEITSNGTLQGWGILLVTQEVLFVVIAAFTGASHFSSSPILKTMIAVFLIFGGYMLFAYLLIKGFYMDNGLHQSSSFIDAANKISAIPKFSILLTIDATNKSSGTPKLAILLTFINLCLLTIAWFRLKEKEI